MLAREEVGLSKDSLTSHVMALISNDKWQPNMDDKLFFFFFLSQSEGHHPDWALWKQACTDVHLSVCTGIFHTNVYVHNQFYALL